MDHVKLLKFADQDTDLGSNSLTPTRDRQPIRKAQIRKRALFIYYAFNMQTDASTITSSAAGFTSCLQISKYRGGLGVKSLAMFGL